MALLILGVELGEIRREWGREKVGGGSESREWKRDRALLAGRQLERRCSRESANLWGWGGGEGDHR